MAKAKAAYGNVSPETFLAAMAQAEQIGEPQETLGEYYYIGVWDGKFQMQYSAGCRTCGFMFEHTCEAQIKLTEPDTE